MKKKYLFDFENKKRYNKSSKLGRGFTLQEIKAAGLTARFA